MTDTLQQCPRCKEMVFVGDLDPHDGLCRNCVASLDEQNEAAEMDERQYYERYQP